MPEIRFSLFNHAFTWSGTEAEASVLLDTQRDLASQLGDPDRVLEEIAMHHASKMLKGDPVRRRGVLATVTAWALQAPIQHPEHRGRLIDYLPAYDFEITIEKGAATIVAVSRDEEIAGSA